MLNNGNNSSCGFAHEIVSYIYDEAVEADRRIFEAHLADCGECTDEFAAISKAHLSMFEWRKKEFDNLPTPKIVIPYPANPRVMDEHVSSGFIAGIREMFSLSSWPAATAIVLTICLGLGFLAIKYIGDRERQIAETVVEGDVRPVASPDVSQPAVVFGSEIPEGVSSPAAKSGVSRIAARPNRASTVNRQPKSEGRPPVPSPEAANVVAIQRNQSTEIEKAPVLSSYEDEGDGTLRLTDLFEEAGT